MDKFRDLRELHKRINATQGMSNVTMRQKKAINYLKKMENVIIKMSDKGARWWCPISMTERD